MREVSAGPCTFGFVSGMVSTPIVPTSEQTNAQAIKYTVVVLGGVLEFNRVADTIETGKGGMDTEIHSEILLW